MKLPDPHFSDEPTTWGRVKRLLLDVLITLGVVLAMLAFSVALAWLVTSGVQRGIRALDTFLD